MLRRGREREKERGEYQGGAQDCRSQIHAISFDVVSKKVTQLAGCR
jgi:hypothetical protein